MAAPRLALYAHPFSSYCQKALTALYELDLAFDYKLLDGSEPAASEFAALWPIGKFPVLTDGDRTIVEASAIIEYLDACHTGTFRLIPTDPEAAVEVRMLDRIFDNYVMTPMQTIVGDALRPAGAHDPHGVAAAHAMLDRSYRWLEERLGKGRAAGSDFSLADCAAAPALLYADWVHAIPDAFGTLASYRARLLARPSYARALDEARPHRHLFPLGAPVDRD